MRSRAKSALLLLLPALLTLLLAQPAHGQPAAKPSAAQLKRAAEAYDEGLRAFKAGENESAASQFELAFSTAPNAQVLRMALWARDKAGQAARAATLAEQARRLYPEDEKIQKLADEVLKKHGPTLHRLEVECASPCVLAVGTRLVPGPPSQQMVLQLAPGEVTVSASFSDGGSADHALTATAGGSGQVKLEPRAQPEPPPAKPAPPPPPPPPDKPSPPATKPAVQPEVPPDGSDDSSGKAPPALFFIGLGLTAVGVGVTIWSGIDTINNPGTDVVREKCAGLGTDCPEYQEGLDRQLRTNALIGVTAGLGLATVIVGIFFTSWSDGEPPEVAPTAWVGPQGGSLGLTGTF